MEKEINSKIADIVAKHLEYSKKNNISRIEDPLKLFNRFSYLFGKDWEKELDKKIVEDTYESSKTFFKEIIDSNFLDINASHLQLENLDSDHFVLLDGDYRYISKCSNTLKVIYILIFEMEYFIDFITKKYCKRNPKRYVVKEFENIILELTKNNVIVVEKK